ncbi:uncharacterized protein LOC115763841 isoform X2 [Drosophila novamexicana]|uniref:uncharacterized protein LOC115763841 isoform X2 n=1 Tax=Drosophila novamexicana TaxID=47314 RepID=UPI0011E5921E|nr:uncharacterized protein LOC115763841 isoform X2 [Drosophila novamexicana]
MWHKLCTAHSWRSAACLLGNTFIRTGDSSISRSRSKSTDIRDRGQPTCAHVHGPEHVGCRFIIYEGKQTLLASGELGMTQLVLQHLERGIKGFTI